jgi:hypothetical protein
LTHFPVRINLHNSSQIPDSVLLKELMMSLVCQQQNWKSIDPDNWIEHWKQTTRQIGIMASLETGVDYCGLGPDGEMMFRLYTAT